MRYPPEDPNNYHINSQHNVRKPVRSGPFSRSSSTAIWYEFRTLEFPPNDVLHPRRRHRRLPSDESSPSITLKEIEKAYKVKARELHPDKRRDDPNATAAFQQLISSYELLKDSSARQAFDTLLRARRERAFRHSRLDSKRRKLADDLEERERRGEKEEDDPRREEKEAAARLKVEVERIRARMRARRSGMVVDDMEDRSEGGGGKGVGGSGVEGMVDKDKVLKVSWDKEGGDYSAERLRELFKRFGEVVDVVIRSKGGKKNKGTALVVMKSKEAVVAATQDMSKSISNHLLVLPLQPFTTTATPEPDVPKFGNILGAGYQAYEDSILQKLQKAAEKQKNSNP